MHAQEGRGWEGGEDAAIRSLLTLSEGPRGEVGMAEGEGVLRWGEGGSPAVAPRRHPNRQVICEIKHHGTWFPVPVPRCSLTDILRLADEMFAPLAAPRTPNLTLVCRAARPLTACVDSTSLRSR